MYYYYWLILRFFLCIPASTVDATAVKVNTILSVDDLSAKTLQRVATCLLVNDNLWEKLVSSSPILFDDNLKTTSVSFSLQTFIH